MAESKLTFRIVEGCDYEDRFDGFHKDFDDGVSKRELMKKYDIPRSMWFTWRDRIFEMNPTHPRRFRRGRLPKPKQVPRIYDEDGSRIKGTFNGNYTIYRKDGNSKKSYGTYKEKSIAEYVRNELVAHNWNRYVAYDLIKEYAMLVSRRCLLPRILERG